MSVSGDRAPRIRGGLQIVARVVRVDRHRSPGEVLAIKAARSLAHRWNVHRYSGPEQRTQQSTIETPARLTQSNVLVAEVRYFLS